MMRPLVIYHAHCPDGFCAAWCAWRALGDDADYRPAQYGEPPPDVSGRETYVVDFSYKRPVMEEILRKAARVVVLDHHRTARAELEGLDAGSGGIVFDMEKSGGRLAWEHFFPGRTAPWLVKYVEDRDLWRWKLDWSKEISAFVASHPHSFALWEDWSRTGPGTERWDTFVDQGSAILRYQSQQVEAVCGGAREVELDGHRVLAANTPVMISEVAGRLAEGRPFGAAWFVRGDGKKVWSLRSRDGGVDVSEIARRHGGGGHTQAAGFEESTG